MFLTLLLHLLLTAKPPASALSAAAFISAVSLIFAAGIMSAAASIPPSNVLCLPLTVAVSYAASLFPPALHSAVAAYLLLLLLLVYTMYVGAVVGLRFLTGVSGAAAWEEEPRMREVYLTAADSKRWGLVDYVLPLLHSPEVQ